MKTCFVIQGFGKKTDYTDGRVLNLDASYEVIKEAVEAAGLQCIRADGIQHSKVIDVPMYEMLLQADLVIADLSTYNVNAVYELGVRYALRPRTTIVVAEEGFKNPFDFNHIALRRYKHAGDDLGHSEAKRFMNDLKAAIQAILADDHPDSPVYTFLPQLIPPVIPPAQTPAQASQPSPTKSSSFADPANTQPGPEQQLMATGARAAALAVNVAPDPAAAPEPVAPVDQSATAKGMLDEALAKINPPDGGASDFAGARNLLRAVWNLRPSDPFVTQQLVLATYKSKEPDPETALLQARAIVELALNPTATNDPETLGLWGAINKRLWELQARPSDLNAAVNGYERGFSLRRDWYNGINYAFLLDVRALEWLKIGRKDDAIADSVLARRVRSDVNRLALAPAEDKEADPKTRFWAIATLWEAAVGRGDMPEIERWGALAESLAVPQWMQETRLEQGKKLVNLKKEFALRSAA